jgi:hypothetical protein
MNVIHVNPEINMGLKCLQCVQWPCIEEAKTSKFTCEEKKGG